MIGKNEIILYILSLVWSRQYVVLFIDNEIGFKLIRSFVYKCNYNTKNATLGVRFVNELLYYNLINLSINCILANMRSSVVKHTTLKSIFLINMIIKDNYR